MPRPAAPHAPKEVEQLADKKLTQLISGLITEWYKRTMRESHEKRRDGQNLALDSMIVCLALDGQHVSCVLCVGAHECFSSTQPHTLAGLVRLYTVG